MAYVNALAGASSCRLLDKQNERTNGSRRIWSFMSIARRLTGSHFYQRPRLLRTTPEVQVLVTFRANMFPATNSSAPCLLPLSHHPLSSKSCRCSAKSEKSLQGTAERHKYYANKRRIASPSFHPSNAVLKEYSFGCRPVDFYA